MHATKSIRSPGTRAETYSDNLPQDGVWLCFPCLLKRGKLADRVDNDVAQRKCEECEVCPQGIYRDDRMPQSSSLLTWTTEDTGGATSSSSSSSANIANASTTCVWCLRYGVRTLPGSVRCLELQRDFVFDAIVVMR